MATPSRRAAAKAAQERLGVLLDHLTRTQALLDIESRRHRHQMDAERAITIARAKVALRGLISFLAVEHAQATMDAADTAAMRALASDLLAVARISLDADRKVKA